MNILDNPKGHWISAQHSLHTRNVAMAILSVVLLFSLAGNMFAVWWANGGRL